jgi:hypothetical protein
MPGLPTEDPWTAVGLAESHVAGQRAHGWTDIGFGGVVERGWSVGCGAVEQCLEAAFEPLV